MFESNDKTFNGLAGLRGSGGYVPGMGRVETHAAYATADSETRLARRDGRFTDDEYCHLLMKSCEVGDFSYAQAIPREMLDEGRDQKKIYDTFWSMIKKYGTMSPERFRKLVEPSRLSDYMPSASLQETADLAYANISVKFWLQFFLKGRDLMLNALAIPNDFLLIIKNATQMYWSLWNRAAGLPSLEDEEYKTSLDCEWGGVNGEVPWGFNSFDNDLGGIRPGEVALLAGEAGTGKTFILCKKAADWVQQGFRVGIVSVEMSDTVIQQRVEACMAHFDPHLFRRRTAPRDLAEIKSRLREVQARAKANGGNIFYFPKGEKSLESVAQRAKDSKLDVLIIDGLYLMRSDEQPNKKAAMWEQMKSVSDGVSRIAQDLGLPILASTQFNRQAREMDFDINSIGYSHAFAQDADAVISLERDPVAPEVRFLSVRKNRNGSVGARIQLNIDWKQMKFGVVDRSSSEAAFSGEKLIEESWEAMPPKRKEMPETLMTPTVLMHTPNGKAIAKDSLSDQPLTGEEKTVLKMARTSLSNVKPDVLPSWDGVAVEKDSGIRSVYKQGDVDLLDALAKEVHLNPFGPYVIYPGTAEASMLLLPARAESLVKKEEAKRVKKLKSKRNTMSTHHKSSTPIFLAATCADSIKLLAEPKKPSAPPKWWKVKIEDKGLVSPFSTDYPEEVKIHVKEKKEYWDALASMQKKTVQRSTWLKWVRSIWVCDEIKEAMYISLDHYGVHHQSMVHGQEAWDEMFRIDKENQEKRGAEDADNRRYTVWDKKKVAKYGGLDIGGAKVKRVERTDQ
jgi:archaellum biogenesis ATPase FlaH